MKKYFYSLFLLISGFAVTAHAENFSVKTSLADSKNIEQYAFNGFGCTGGNKSPSVEWENAPKDTKSFAITMYDPDAPTGSGWWHWTVLNIPASTSKIAENASNDKAKLPKNVIEGRTDFGQANYGGMCPPVGDKPHHYTITVYALKVPTLNLTSDASGAMVGYNVKQNAIASASVTVEYGRAKK